MKAKDILTKNVQVLNKDDTVEKVARILIKNKISGLPVVDEERKVIGMVSEGDLVFQQKKIISPTFISFLDGVIQLGHQKYINELKKIAAYKVEDIMTKNVYSVHLDTSINDISSLMVDKKINRVPVVDDEKKLKGIITRSDIIKNLYKI